MMAAFSNVLESNRSSSSDFPGLSPDQRKLLLAALNSNDRSLDMAAFGRGFDKGNGNSFDLNGQPIFKNALGRSPSSPPVIDPHVLAQPSYIEASPASEASPPSFWGNSPPMLFGTNYLPDMSNGQVTDFNVDLPQNVVDSLAASGSAEKRKNPEDEQDEDDEEQDSKRHDGEDKAPRKPGRKPLTVEPTTKRKAQNRAAQRAFRERKEQHLKDLEQKIADLQKTSQTATQENNLLRAQVMTLQSELQNYKKRLSSGSGLTGSPIGAIPSNASLRLYGRQGTSSNPFDFNFSSPPTLNDQNKPFSDWSDMSAPTPVKAEPTSGSNSAGTSPAVSRAVAQTPQRSGSTSQSTMASMASGSLNLGASNYGYSQFGSPNSLIQSSPEATNLGLSSPSQHGSVSTSTFSQAPSPASSSMSHQDPSSSCETSPEPSHESQNQDLTIDPKDFGLPPLGDLSQFKFDPTPFGAYRETQDAIFGDGDFSGGLYDDFLNMPDDTFNFLYDKPAPQPASNKPTLLEEVDRAKDSSSNEEIVQPSPPTDKSPKSDHHMVTTNKMWQELKTCSKFRQGELDIDSLCSELSQKATCGSTGTVIPKDEWESALWRLVGKPNGAKGNTGTGVGK